MRYKPLLGCDNRNGNDDRCNKCCQNPHQSFQLHKKQRKRHHPKRLFLLVNKSISTWEGYYSLSYTRGYFCLLEAKVAKAALSLGKPAWAKALLPRRSLMVYNRVPNLASAYGWLAVNFTSAARWPTFPLKYIESRFVCASMF